MYSVRTAAIVDKLPVAVMWMLLMVSAATAAVTGYNTGSSGRMSRWRIRLFAIILVFITTVIMDLDRSTYGWIQLNQSSMTQLIADMERALDR